MKHVCSARLICPLGGRQKKSCDVKLQADSYIFTLRLYRTNTVIEADMISQYRHADWLHVDAELIRINLRRAPAPRPCFGVLICCSKQS